MTKPRIPRAPAKGDRTAVLLLSGGLDSATCLALAARWRWRIHALSFDYGQRHAREVEAARHLAGRFGAVSHRVVALPGLGALGGSALTDRAIDVPKQALGAVPIPVTYVPARNTIFLSLALGWAEVLSAQDIVIGVNALDYSGYPDCRPEFIAAFERLANLATRAGVEGARFRIHTPLISLGKADIIRRGLELGLDYGLTHSCYDPRPNGRPCGACDSCVLRAKGFTEAGVPDPLLR
jgi:7-cyano-7-deazaguanine synthase